MKLELIIDSVIKHEVFLDDTLEFAKDPQLSFEQNVLLREEMVTAYVQFLKEAYWPAIQAGKEWHIRMSVKSSMHREYIFNNV